ncbi:MAG: hypothetical protein RIQ50_1369 [Bacteroidota bacterium]|jgi:hypothetical protein
MKRITFFFLLIAFPLTGLFAQQDNWKKQFTALDDDSLRLAATYSIDAHLHRIANQSQESERFGKQLASAIKHARSFYAKEYLISIAGILGSDQVVPALSKLLLDAQWSGPASRSLATIRSASSIAALNTALIKAQGESRQNIESALKYVQYQLPSAQAENKPLIGMVNMQDPRFLLKFQDDMQKTADPVERRRLLNKLEAVTSFPALMVTAGFLDDPLLKHQAASIVARMALRQPSLRGRAPRQAVEKAKALIRGTDSIALNKLLASYLKAIPYDNGWESLFNGKDLTGWKGLVGNPITRSKMSEDELLKAEGVANAQIQNDWIVENGLLVFTGHGDNLCTRKKYRDFEMYVDWKITAKGDAGIYLRGSPQVQIWDTSRRESGAQVGSGGLYNNQKNQSKPLMVADHPIGEWNTFHIIMKGEKVTVYLNGQKVTDETVLENYWDRNLPIFAEEQIELQAHGTYVAYRNLYIRELNPPQLSLLTEQEKKEGFEPLFDGTHLNKWIGNKEGYVVEDGAIVTYPGRGKGNLFTAEQFSDFEYRFEFQLTPGSNNGLGIRTPTEGDAAYVGMELQILDNEAPIYEKLKPYQYHGSVYGVIPAKRGYLLPTGEWNKQTVIAKGSKIKVILNDQVILDGDIKEASLNGTADGQKHPGLLNGSGHIGFLGHGDVVRFRNIRIRKL